MVEHPQSNDEHRTRASTYGLDLTKRKDREFYTMLTKHPKMKRLWLEHRKSIAVH